ncbi:MAG: putative monovalent cation/H+ antiporter subunit A [Anaerolineae bacterium]|nr:putative monovalent cation/H+ antiporter subunit A [Anaerolineae bacterium]MCX8068414.1 putative monovalent cation/H+ antiporter subunit A [Anaerolineae bacterium]MDW7991550.1 putative monovalent cation/H+ antiporter subunit A [Anaerolineae bacterium]
MQLLIAVFSGFLLALLAPMVVRLTRGKAGWVLALLPAGLTVYFARYLELVAAGETVAVSYPWVPSLRVSLSFYLDGLSLLMALLICGIGTLVVIYAGSYLKGHSHLGRFYLYLLMFMASMLGLVLADNGLTMFIFWELTSLTSFLLIGFEHEREAARAAALQALLVTGAGGLALLAGLVLLGQVGGSPEFSTLLKGGRAIQSHPLYLPILLLVLAGAFTKSAQFPFHFWLPGAMEAPTPVSAYLHSATMVKAGVYLLARLSPVLGGSEAWHYLVTGAGTTTMLLGALVALWQRDLKRLLAYSTVSALGALILLLGLDTVLSVKAATLFLLAHALYKGALFLVAGAVDHETGTRDVTRLGGLAQAMPITAVAAGLAAFSMAGLPPMLGFINKELLYEANIQAPRAAPLVTVAGILANVFLVVVAGTVGLAPFFRRYADLPKKPHEAPPAMLLGPVVLAGISLFCGLYPDLVVNSLLLAAVRAVRPEVILLRLKLWHGLNPVFALSVATLVAGAGLYAVRDTLRYAGALGDAVGRYGPQQWYNWLIAGLNGLARAQTRLLQHGYLRLYLMTIVLVTVGSVGSALVLGGGEVVLIRFVDVRFYEWAIAALILLGALAAVTTSSRLAAAAALSVVGYGVALIYMLFGAPDLAMTQFAVETLTVILFVLVVYRLPRFAALSSRRTRLRDALLALLAGGLMTVLVLMVTALSREPHLARFFAQNSWLLAKGRNVVNVILVDFRGLDTLGEITVLGVAAIGVYALLRLILTPTPGPKRDED